ncbi:MAG: hypothetical protein L0Z53_07580, partial [Acidobacteriales bacterium]|nr:hypothetical protein [Terriglobales bacterium]
MNIGVTNRCLFRLIFFGLVYACLGGATALYAQADPCERPGGKRGDGDDLKCRMGILLEKQKTFLENTKAHTDARCTSSDGCDRVKKSMERALAKRNRAASVHDRATAKDYEDITVKGNGKRKKQGGGNSGGGEQTAEDQQNEDEEPQPDPAIGEDLANELDEAIEAIDDANTALAAESTGEQALLGLNQATGKFEASYGFGRSERTGPILIGGTFTAFRLSQLASQIAEIYCKQTAVVAGFGGNFSVGCAVIRYVAGLAELAYETLDFLDGDIDSAEIEGAYERA